MLNKTLDTYESREIFLSFNGGKDCTVLLHMFANLFKNRHPNETLLCLYIQPENSFDEIEEFIVECQKQYPIKMEIIRGTVKSALFGICQRYPHLKAVVMGCRQTDPYCSNLNEFQVKSIDSFVHSVSLHSIGFPCISTEYWFGVATIDASQPIVKVDMPRYLELFTPNERALLFAVQKRVIAWWCMHLYLTWN